MQQKSNVSTYIAPKEAHKAISCLPLQPGFKYLSQCPVSYSKSGKSEQANDTSNNGLLHGVAQLQGKPDSYENFHAR